MRAFKICGMVQKWPVWPMPRVRAARATGSSASTARGQSPNGCLVRVGETWPLSAVCKLRRSQWFTVASWRSGISSRTITGVLLRNSESRTENTKASISVPTSKEMATSTIASTASGTERWRQRSSPRARASRSRPFPRKRKLARKSRRVSMI